VRASAVYGVRHFLQWAEMKAPGKLSIALLLHLLPGLATAVRCQPHPDDPSHACVPITRRHLLATDFADVPPCEPLLAIVRDDPQDLARPDAYLGNLTREPPTTVPDCVALWAASATELERISSLPEPAVKVIELRGPSSLFDLGVRGLRFPQGSVNIVNCNGKYVDYSRAVVPANAASDATLLWYNCRLVTGDHEALWADSMWVIGSQFRVPCVVRCASPVFLAVPHAGARGSDAWSEPTCLRGRECTHAATGGAAAKTAPPTTSMQRAYLRLRSARLQLRVLRMCADKRTSDSACSISHCGSDKQTARGAAKSLRGLPEHDFPVPGPFRAEGSASRGDHTKQKTPTWSATLGYRDDCCRCALRSRALLRGAVAGDHTSCLHKTLEAHCSSAAACKSILW
jgi:hypothetical protein